MQTYEVARTSYEIALGNFEYTKAFFDTESEEFFNAREELTRAEDDLNEDKHILSELRSRKARADADDEVARARAIREAANEEADFILSELAGRVEEAREQAHWYEEQASEAYEVA